MYFIEARHKVITNPNCSLGEFNQMFKKWVNWYNTEKPHCSQPKNCPPVKRFLGVEDHVFRPLQAKIN